MNEHLVHFEIGGLQFLVAESHVDHFLAQESGLRRLETAVIVLDGRRVLKNRWGIGV